MTKFKAGIIATTLLAAISISACKKSGTSPSSKTSQLSFQVKADNGTNLAATSASGLTTNAISGLTFTSGTANISQFKLETKRNGVETEIKTKNLDNVDLFAPSPLSANITIDTGVYREIEIKVVLQKTTSGAIPLKLGGTFTNGSGNAVPFEFDLNDDVTIKAEAENITVSSTTDFVALIHLHLNKLLAGISSADLNAATLTGGTLVISSSSNTAIYNRILANATTCGESEFQEHHKNGNDDGSGHN